MVLVSERKDEPIGQGRIYSSYWNEERLLDHQTFVVMIILN